MSIFLKIIIRRAPLVVMLMLISMLTGCGFLAGILGSTTDLTITSVVVDEDSIEVTVLNSGSQSISNIAVAILLSTDGSVDLNDNLVETFYITVGSDLDETETVAFTDLDLSAVETGRYRVGAIVDPDNDTAESNEVNNTSVAVGSIVANPVELTENTGHSGSVGAGDASYYTYWFTLTMGSYIDLRLEALSGNADLYFYLRDSGYISAFDSSTNNGTTSEYIWSYDVAASDGSDGYLYFSVESVDTSTAHTYDITVEQYH